MKYATIKKNVLSSRKIDNFELKRNIQLKNISFFYKDPDKKILQDLNLNIEIGSRIGIVGASGVGKSTFLDLFLGLLPPTSGQITFDGRSTFEDLCFENWQKDIAYVPQEVFLFNRSIAQNISLNSFNKDVDYDLVIKSLKEAQIYDWVLSLDDGIDYLIQENGSNLSGGQRQRLSIARALYRRPRFLILDEPTSSLDQNTEKEILKTLLKLDKHITLIIVSHNINSLSKCDFIYKLINGKFEKFIIN